MTNLRNETNPEAIRSEMEFKTYRITEIKTVKMTLFRA